MSGLAARWRRLLSARRPGAEEPAGGEAYRTDFQRDYDRIVFSSAFRRLQDKTQVFPLAESDYVRTRLTHSIEASCVGRTLGTRVGETLVQRHDLGGITPADVGAIVAAACLAHDIGNPPFGHTGEDAIRHWFATSALGHSLVAELDPQQREDFLRFEGNAQGFRVITRLQTPSNRGGLQLTAAVLGAFTKYPRRSHITGPPAGVGTKKHGFFAAEEPWFAEVAEATGLEPVSDGVWQRHPLAWLVEAADDITYQIVDLEDGFRQGHVPFETARDLLLAVADDSRTRSRLAGIGDGKGQIEYLRAKAINTLAGAAAERFLAHEEAIVAGGFETDLIGGIPQAEAFRAICVLSQRQIYTARPVVEVEAAGFEVLGGLLALYMEAVAEAAGDHPSTRSRTLLHLIPDQFLGAGRLPDPDPYTRLLQVTDYVGGMTDTYAVATFKKLRGISLPGA